MSVVLSGQAAQPSSLEMHGHTETLQRWNAGTASPSDSSRGGRPGSLLSLKAHYRKLRTFKGTIRAVINIRRVPLLLAKIAEASPTLAESEGDDQRSAVSGVPRISTTATSRVQSHVHDLVAGGHVITELDPSSTEVTYRQQGNLEHYTEDNIAKRLRLQKDPHMIALTQRLWNCALRDGETKLSFAGYEAYMLCLHRLILPEFDLVASKELIQDDWARDCGRKEQLDYSYFHLSMFELVDLWTDTVDSEDYISLLYCIMHCLTFTRNNCHVLRSLEDVRSVDILGESKGLTLLGIEQDLQREMMSEAFEDYRNQVELATSTILETSKGFDQEGRGESGGEEGQKEGQSRRPSMSSGSRDRKSTTADTDADGRTKALSLQSASRSATPRSRARGAAERKRSSGDARGAAVRNATATKDSGTASQQSGTLGDSVSAGTPFTQESPKCKLSAQPKPSGLEFSMDASHGSPSSPRRDAGPKRENSTNVFTLGGGVILSVGAVDRLTISQSHTDGKPSVATRTMNSSDFARRRSRSASNASQQQRREQLLQASEKSMASPLQVTHPDFALRTGSQDPNTPGYTLIPTFDASLSHGQPFTIRAAAVAAAAATMAIPASPVNKRPTVSTQRSQQHQLSYQLSGDGLNDTSVVPTIHPAKHSEELLPPSLIANHSSLTAPLMTISSGKTSVDRDGVSSRRMTRQQTQHNADHRPPPYGISGSALASPRADNVPMSLTSAAVMSYRQGSAKPPTSPHQVTGTMSQRSGLVISMGNNYQSPVSPTDKRKYSGHSEGAGGRSPARTGSNPSSPMILAISGRTATLKCGTVRTTTPYQQPENPSPMSGLPDGILRGSALAPPEAADVLAAVYSLKEPSRLSSPPRYILSNVGTTPSAQPSPMSPTTPKHDKLSGMRPQESVRGFAAGNGQHKSLRSHHHTLEVVTGPALSQLQQSQRQQQVSELQSLAITPLNLR